MTAGPREGARRAEQWTSSSAFVITADDIPWARFRGESSSFEPVNFIYFVVEVILEAQSYRRLAQSAMHALHEEQRKTRAHDDLKDEYRRFRERVMLESGAEV